MTLSPHARARVLRIDTTKASAHPGVVRVATAADVPGNRWYGLIYADWPGFVAVGEDARCVGDVLAAVAAVDERTAREAAALVEVEYDVLRPVDSPTEALAPGAPRVNPMHDNLLSHSIIRRGDADAALASSVHLVSGTWQTQRIEHLFLEPESALAEPLPEGRLHLFTQGQGIFDDRRQVASFLGLPEDRIVVELVPNGGAFGDKEDMSIQAPGMNGIECVARLRQALPTVKIIMLTVFEEGEQVFKALAAGGFGYLVKSVRPAKLLEAIREVNAGGSPMSGNIARKVVQSFQSQSAAASETDSLSARELQVLQSLSKGHTYKQMRGGSQHQPGHGAHLHPADL